MVTFETKNNQYPYGAREVPGATQLHERFACGKTVLSLRLPSPYTSPAQGTAFSISHVLIPVYLFCDCSTIPLVDKTAAVMVLYTYTPGEGDVKGV